VTGLPKTAGGGLSMGPSEMADMLGSSYYPGREVAVGESWTSEIVREKMRGKVTSTLMALETADNQPCARIKSVIDLPLNLTAQGTTTKGVLKSEIVSLVLRDKGTLYRGEGKMDMSMDITMGEGGQSVHLGMQGKVKVAPYDPAKPPVPSAPNDGKSS